ncbi:MAG: hypothetical protein F6K54_30560 [Okeania sp. SIO3B5]|uniref:hypothetical protein n=1 Tax=Okeania sp. SIO3B5 TaxID=2607811 RepID=UPI0013FFBD1F|nr:hypothetical protein [Okeania sp. SIO3B5]NEO57033.1 hypothetical protein [Okeania sp. SIO3B5]
MDCSKYALFDLAIALTNSEVRSQKSEVNQPLTPANPPLTPPRRGGEVGDLSNPPKTFPLKRRGDETQLF